MERKMLMLVKSLGLTTAFLCLLMSGAQAADVDKAVAARKAAMQLRGFYISQLAAMAKGKVAYDAKKATMAANSLLAVSTLDASAMWVPGSGTDKLGTKTRAKPEIWSTYPKIADEGKAMTAALENMVTVAGNGLDALRSSIGPVGKACGSCHETFRAPKN